MNFFNVEVFGTNKIHAKSSESMALSTPLCTWEDDFLNDLDNNVSNGLSAQNTTSTVSAHSIDFGNINNSAPGLPCPDLLTIRLTILLIIRFLALPMLQTVPNSQQRLAMPWYQFTTILE